MKRWIPVLAVAVAVSGVPADAHHAISVVYDSSQQVKVEGIVNTSNRATARAN